MTDQVTIFPAPGGVRGTLRVPGDKSVSHRALILAALADGTSQVSGLSTGDDVGRTRAAVTALGARVEGHDITGGPLHEATQVIDVGNSGTAIRLLAGVAASHPFLTVLAGDESVARRPMARVAEPLRRMGATIDGRDGGRYPPLAVRGGDLRGQVHTLEVASAQVKSAILLAGLRADRPTSVTEPAVTRRHTEELLALAGVPVEVDGTTVTVTPAPVRPFILDVPGDPSQAAFWIVAACVLPESEVTVDHVYLGPARDAFLDVLRRMGADLTVEEAAGRVTARSSRLRATSIGGDEIPGLIDELPILAVAAACADGTTIVRDAAELRVKETDRVATITSELGGLGARVEALADGFTVEGGGRLRGGELDTHGDHRIGMAGAIAALTAAEPTTIRGFHAVGTSYPGFLDDLVALVGDEAVL